MALTPTTNYNNYIFLLQDLNTFLLATLVNIYGCITSRISVFQGVPKHSVLFRLVHKILRKRSIYCNCPLHAILHGVHSSNSWLQQSFSIFHPQYLLIFHNIICKEKNHERHRNHITVHFLAHVMWKENKKARNGKKLTCSYRIINSQRASIEQPY